MQFMGLEDTNAALAQTLRETAIAQQSLPLSATDAMGSMTQSMVSSWIVLVIKRPYSWGSVGSCTWIALEPSLCAPRGTTAVCPMGGATLPCTAPSVRPRLY